MVLTARVDRMLGLRMEAAHGHLEVVSMEQHDSDLGGRGWVQI